MDRFRFLFLSFALFLHSPVSSARTLLSFCCCCCCCCARPSKCCVAVFLPLFSYIARQRVSSSLCNHCSSSIGTHTHTRTTRYRRASHIIVYPPVRSLVVRATTRAQEGGGGTRTVRKRDTPEGRIQKRESSVVCRVRGALLIATLLLPLLHLLFAPLGQCNDKQHKQDILATARAHTHRHTHRANR
uniref:Putative secreted protein n=1 Tax=Anopheles darlingi TaxID=43151 RepID=A0A2M4DCQ9_ANODA